MPNKKLLIITMEECGELIRACSKIIRSNNSEKAKENMLEELADVMACISLLAPEYKADDQRVYDKMRKLTKETYDDD